MRYRHILILMVFASVVFVGCTMCRCVGSLQYLNMREVFSDLLPEHIGFSDNKGSVLCARDVGEAMRLFDDFMLPTLEDKSSRRIRRLRNRIASGMSWVYYVDGNDDVAYYLLNLFPERRYGRYGFNYFVCNLSKSTKNYNPLGENHGFLELEGLNKFSEEGGYRYDKACKRFPEVVEMSDDDPPRWGYEMPDVIAVVDVVDVQLVNVNGFDRIRLYPTCSEECIADYSIRMDIRSIEKGVVDAGSLILAARRRWSEFGCYSWLYYRGMTLRIGLRRNDYGYVLVNIHPVIPYEPFSEDDVIVSGGFRTGRTWKEMQEGKLSPLVVQYGGHTKVEFLHGEIINCGHCGSFPDFGVTASVKIVELSDDSNKEYWEDAWFVEYDECYIYEKEFR